MSESHTMIERAQHLRTLDLLKLSMMELGAQCQVMGVSGRGEREELIERLHKRIWSKEFDEHASDVRTVTYDIGNTVLCDLCNANYTGSKAIGGFIFGSKAVCPTCAPDFEASAKRYGEEGYIVARAKPDQSFYEFVLEYCGPERQVTITSFPRRK